jgi:hypothetical protein
MKHKLLFITFLACFSGWGQVIIMSEDFSSITAGNNTSTSGSSSTWTGNTNFPTVVSAYQSGSSVKIGASAAIGSLTSKPLDLSVNGGNFTLNFDVKGWTTVEGSIKVTITSQTVQTITYSAVMASSSFETKTINFTGGVSNSTIKIETTAKRAFLDNIISSPTSTTYTTSWSNSAPIDAIDAIINGDLTTTTDLICKDLTINSGKTLTIGAGKKLSVTGNLINNGTIIFKSDVNGTAMFDVFNGAQSGTGVVTTERFIPAKRAFRFLSSSVTTSTSIKLNWQENTGTTAGFGTHITGDNGAINGFDTTITNNPSLFTFNPTSALWEAVINTNSNVLNAGTAYRILIRGDRTTDLSTNAAAASSTILRASGTLKTGSFSPTLNQAAEGFSFVGNPYQAPVDIKAVLNAATNMNTGVVYYWDPTLNARGGYVTRDLSSNTNDVTSNFNEFLQPGQAVFVKKSNTVSAASITFTESHKSAANAAAGVFKTTPTNDYGLIRVNLQANTNNQWQTIEGAVAIFNSDFNTAVTEEDATKMTNLDEEVSFVQNNTALAIACQPYPALTSELPIRLNNTRHTNYQWQFDVANYSGPTPFLVDTQNNSITPITNTTVVPFTANTNVNRFKIVFQNAALNLLDFSKQLALYPNPAKAGESFYIDGIPEANVTIFNVLGQSIQVQTKLQGNSVQVTPSTSLSKGVYLVNITSEGNKKQVKWIVE